MSNEVLIAVITTMGGVMIAILTKMGRIGKDSAAAREASERAESSLNNSPHTVTERLLAMSNAQAAQGNVLTEIQESQDGHSRDIRGVRQDIGILQGADRRLRQDLTDHLDTTDKTVKRVNETAATLEKFLPHLEQLAGEE